MSTFFVAGKKFAFQLTSITDINSKDVVGYQANSIFIKNLNDHENLDESRFFSELAPHTLLTVINRQLEIYQKWHTQHPAYYHGKFLLINTRAELLNDAFFTLMFLPFSKEFHIVISIDTSTCKLDVLMQEKIDELTSLGISVWVDTLSLRDKHGQSTYKNNLQKH